MAGAEILYLSYLEATVEQIRCLRGVLEDKSKSSQGHNVRGIAYPAKCILINLVGLKSSNYIEIM